MYPATNTMDTNLVAITRKNQNLTWRTIDGDDYVLVSTWKWKNNFGDPGKCDTTKGQVWVTTVPELKERMSRDTAADRDLRLKQLLGLPPSLNYYLFIEFWVKPCDLFRPCPDKEISDSKCNTCFTSRDSLDKDHVRWVNDTRISSYYGCGLYNQYPWTQLGYTYDWNPDNKSHIGLSEFIIDVNKIIYVNKVDSTAAYLQKTKK